MRPEPVIRTERLVLRPYRAADAGPLAEQIGDFAVAGMLAKVPFPYGVADAEAFFVALAGNDGRDIALAITRDDALVGGIGLNGVASERELGYWLGRPHWGQGYATEAAGGFLDWLFDELGLAIVRSGVFHDNPASLRVQKKLGFVETGTREVLSLARKVKVRHIDTLLTREAFAATV